MTRLGPYVRLAMHLSLAVVITSPIRQSLAVTCFKAFPATMYPNCVQLSKAYALHWSVRNSTVYFGVEVDQLGGWFGLGLSEAGAMKGSDVWILTKGRQDPRTGEVLWRLQDSFATEHALPIADTIQDVQLMGEVQESANSTSFELRRQLHTCDQEQDLQMTMDDLITVIWAYGRGSEQHTDATRGSLKLRLRGNQGASLAAAPGQMSLEMRMPATPLEAVDPLFLCRIFPVPLKAKQHAVKVTYIAASPYVQSMVLYACSSIPAAKLVGKVYRCPVMPLSSCRTVFSSWALGSEVDNMPANAGFPVGPGGTNYFTLQVRYSVEAGTTGAKDTSGAILTYTPQLREFDLGILQLTQTWLTIPAGTPDVTSPPSVCPSECTARLPTSLTLVAQSMHMHKTGKTIETKHIRGGVELAPIGRRSSWDPRFVAVDSVPVETSELRPGDTLVTTCSFNTAEKDTIYGSGTENEMCANYVRYYPATDLQLCMNLNPDEWSVNATAAVALCANRDKLDTLTSSQSWGSLKEYTKALLTKGLLLAVAKEQGKEGQYRAFDKAAGCSAVQELSPPPVPPPPVSPEQQEGEGPQSINVGVGGVPVVGMAPAVDSAPVGKVSTAPAGRLEVQGGVVVMCALMVGGFLGLLG